MEYEHARGLSKTNKIAIIVGAAIICLVAVIGVIIAINTNSSFRASNDGADLATQIESEKVKIADAFKRRFQFLNDRYRIEKIVLTNEGEYAVVLLELNSASYRSILRRENDKWTVVGVPAVVLYYEDFQEIPRDVVRAANDLGSGKNE